MTFNNTKSITGDIVIGEDDNDLMIVNSNIISNGYIKKPTRFKPKTTIVGTPFTLNFGNALDIITHLDDADIAIDTRVYLDDIKDINKVLVMGKIHIGYNNFIFASVLLIKRLYDSSGSPIIIPSSSNFQTLLGAGVTKTEFLAANTNSSISVFNLFSGSTLDRGFDNYTGTFDKCLCLNNGGSASVLFINFGDTGKKVEKVRIWARSDNRNEMVRKMTIEGSFDNNTYTTLFDNQSSPFNTGNSGNNYAGDYPFTTDGMIPSENLDKANTITLTNTAAYKYYNLKFYENSGQIVNGSHLIGELALYEKTPNIEVGSGSDDIPNTTDSFFDASIGISAGGAYNFRTALNNMGGHFLDTNPTEGVSGVSKISYHYAIKPLHNVNNGIKVGQPWNAGDRNRCSAATMLTLVPFCS
jgi:hypothetical protein